LSTAQNERIIMNGERLKAARKMAGLSLEELAQKVGELTKQAISYYETGKRQPDSKTLLRLAKVLGVRPEYFLRRDEIEFGAFEYRKKAKMGEKAKGIIEEKARYVAERYLEIEELLEFGKDWENPLKGLEARDGNDVEKAALELRKRWQLGTDAIIKLIETLETYGIMIIGVDADDNFDGLTNFANGKPIIIYNERIKDNVRIRFTIAHELGHILLNLSEIKDIKEKEKLCHQFAGAFLLPKEKIYLELGGKHRSKIAFSELISMKEEYGISIQAIAKRLQYLKIISDSAYTRFNIIVNKNKWRQNEPGEFKIEEKPEKFKNLVLRALAEEIISIGKAASLLNTSISDLEKSVRYVI
jgi:Zn-dependent peptidase ImmA (M78 family)